MRFLSLLLFPIFFVSACFAKAPSQPTPVPNAAASPAASPTANSTASAAAKDLSSYKWKNRILLVLADAGNNADLKKQRAEIAQAKTQIAERELVVLEELDPKGEWHTKYQVQAGFAVILFGKDGFEKWRKTSFVKMNEIFTQIDAMPMRQSELKDKKPSK